ncbi:MAG TPA: hypothetical protein VK599_22210, partial [Streptosporangiaceae bacterium]|nr:hypothetical protein [Streptosporangiaceae bacterium]
MSGPPGTGLGIAVASGMLRGVFGHGVLSAFEEAGLRAEVYGVASSSVLSGGLAAIGQARAVGVDYWQEAAEAARSRGMSRVARDTIDRYAPRLRAGLLTGSGPRLLLAASRVSTAQAAEITQGKGAARLGRQLLRDILAGDPGWAGANLETVVFDSRPAGAVHRPLTEDNFDEVSYASTRMLHNWAVPASVAGEAFVDASYTCSCPAREVTATGVGRVVVISAEPGPVHRDLYRSEEIT